MLAVEPELVAHDLHPDYLSTRWAHEQDAELRRRPAPPRACRRLPRRARRAGAGAGARLRRHRLRHRRDALGRRAAALRPRALRAASRTSSRCPCPAARRRSASRGGLRRRLPRARGRPVPFERWPAVRESLKVNAPLLIRDGAAVRRGRRAARRARGGELRGPGRDRARAARRTRPRPSPTSAGSTDGVIRGADLVAAAHDDLARRPVPRARSRPPSTRASRAAAARACAEAAEPRTVVLSGGSFQNLRLLESLGAPTR